MKIEILQEELLKGLNLVLRAVSQRTQLPVLSSIHITAEASELILSTTDLEIGIKTRISSKVIEKGALAVSAKTLNELLMTLRPGKIELELEDQTLKIKSGSFVGKVMTTDASEFPRLPEFGESMVEVSAQELIKGITSVSYASAKESLRPVLTGILLEVTEHMGMVATDGFRLAVAAIGIRGSTTKRASNFLLPARALTEVSKIMKEGVIQLAYLEESKQVLFKSDSTLLVAQVIEGSFPDYNKILPKEFVVELNVSSEELMSAVKTALVFARDNSNMMRWKVANGKIIISSSSAASGEGVIEVPAKVDGEEVEVVFNAKYVLDYLLLNNSASVWVGLGGKLAPGMIAESLEKRDTAFYVVMPINA